MRLIIGLIAGLVAVGLWLHLSSRSDDPPAPAATVAEVERDTRPAAQPGNEAVTEGEPGFDPGEDASDSGPRRVVIENQGDFFSIMAELGLEDMEQRFSQWSLEHGYPFSDHTGVLLLEQPYDQYDDETLRAFADNEDMWAQQFLAKRLERTRPAEAIDWYRKAAINGSLYAMDQLTTLYGKLERARADGPDTDAIYKEQLVAVRDSVDSAQEMGFAWSMASVMAGGDPGRNKMTLDTLSRNFDDEQLQRACDMASSLYSDISSQRQSRGMDDFSRSPPPLMMGSLSDATLPCSGPMNVPHVDTSQCEELVVVLAGSENELVVCSD